MSAADHVPTPVQDTALKPFYVRCSCGWQSERHPMVDKAKPAKSAWGEFREHYRDLVMTQRVVTPAPSVEALQMFDPEEYR